MGAALRLDGAVNARDFGGVAADGGHVRAGVLYRSDQLSALSAGDFARLEALGIGLICDLRSEQERERLPTRWPEGRPPCFLPLDVAGDPRAGALAFWDRIGGAGGEAGIRDAMLELYRGLPRRFEKALPILFDRLTAPDCPPLLIHCHAGKDRTGFACAMILAALGVAPDAIAEDYLATRIAAAALAARSGIAAAAERRLGVALSPAALAFIESVLPEYLDAALGAVESGYGSLEAYLRDVGGLSSPKRERLRAFLLE